MRFLDPEKCALPIIDGRSDDGTIEILQLLGKDLERIGITYHLNSSAIDQGVGEAFARLRSLAQEPLIKLPERYSTNATMNLALEPLMYPERYSTNAIVIFLNDVSVCMEDILELIHQRVYQHADMTCPTDWIFGKGLEREPTFYNVWVTRGMGPGVVQSTSSGSTQKFSGDYMRINRSRFSLVGVVLLRLPQSRYSNK
jgi:alpha-1,3-mannosyltransferase